MWDGTRVLSGRPCGNHVDIYPYVNAMYFNCFMVVIKGPSTNAKFIPVGLSMTFYLDTFRSARFKPPQFNPAFGPGQSSGFLVDLNEDGALPLVKPNSRLLQPGIQSECYGILIVLPSIGRNPKDNTLLVLWVVKLLDARTVKIT